MKFDANHRPRLSRAAFFWIIAGAALAFAATGFAPPASRPHGLHASAQAGQGAVGASRVQAADARPSQQGDPTAAEPQQRGRTGELDESVNSIGLLTP